MPTVKDVNDPAAAQRLVYGSALVKAGTFVQGTLPAPGSGVPAGARTTLVAVVAAKRAEDSCPSAEGGARKLDRSTVTDLTEKAKNSAFPQSRGRRAAGRTRPPGPRFPRPR
ncbi:hypothetical protein [Actinomadura sp. RB99]|uniref:hypothetical protein n=1 Tax=Actinomadura sp. RB99 TaxID=2691577 RepID=UPI001689D5E9|nr:hypothetical protein [Actinomadura sp. RB99]